VRQVRKHATIKAASSMQKAIFATGGRFGTPRSLRNAPVCVVEEYSSFKAVDDVAVNGKLTLGENIADNGGLRVAYMALMEDLATKTMPEIDGFSPEKRFFISYAQVWCQNATEEFFRLRAQPDHHSPHKVRVNGAVQNMPGFQSAFGCRVGQPMVRKSVCRVW